MGGAAAPGQLALRLRDGRSLLEWTPPAPKPGDTGELARIVSLRDHAPKQWQAACWQFALANEGLAHQAAMRLIHRGVPLEDLLAAARVGLYKAACEWDPGRKSKFSTFAVPKMRHELRDVLERSVGVVRYPHNAATIRNKAVQRLEAGAELGDVAQELGKPVKRLVELMTAPSAVALPDVSSLGGSNEDQPGLAMLDVDQALDLARALAKLPPDLQAAVRRGLGLEQGSVDAAALADGVARLREVLVE